jgi:hypothetical protein
MKLTRPLAVLAVLVALCGPVTGDDGTTASWVTYAYEAASFSVSMPGTPTYELKKLDNGVDMHMHILEHGNDAYLVTHIDYPEGTMKGTPEETLEGARDGSIRGKKKLSERALEIGGYPGLDLRTQDENFVSGVRIFLVGNRLYTIIVAMPRASKDEAVMQSYLESFRIVYKAEPPR